MTTNTNTFKRTSDKRTKTTDSERIYGKSNRNNGRLFCESRSKNSKERQINQNSTRFTKIERTDNKTKRTNAKHVRTNCKNLRKIIRRRRRWKFEIWQQNYTSMMRSDKLNWINRHESYSFLPLRTENSLVITVSWKDSMVWQISQQFSQNGSIKHWNTKIRHGSTI